MITFFVITGVISLCVLGLVLFPLFRRRSEASVPGRGNYDIAIYRDQLKEVEKDLERNLLNQDQAEAARTEIKRRMLDASPQDADTSSPTVSSPFQRRALIAAIVVLLPLGAFSLYFYLGVPGLPSVPFAERHVPTKEPVISDRDRKLLDNLTAHMKKTPDNINGWLLLGRSYSSLGLNAKAVGAYEQALKLAPDRVDIGSNYGEALVLAADRVVTFKAEQVFTGVLKAAPRDFRARYYLGLAKAQRGDVGSAVQDWVDLLAVAPKDAPWRASVEKVIATAAKDIGLDSTKLKPSAAALGLAKSKANPSVMAKSLATRRPSRAEVDAINKMSLKDREAIISSMVERLAAQMEKNPNNIDGWRKLARAYKVLGKTEKAAQARKRVESLVNAGKGKDDKLKAGPGK